MRKVAFVGGGNMAEGIIKSMISSSQFSPKEISVFDILEKRMKYLVDSYGVKSNHNVAEAVLGAKVVILAVRPQDANQTSLQMKPSLGKNSILVSICAGITIEMLDQWFVGQKIVRIMPNTLTETKHGFSGYCLNNNTTKEDIEVVIEIFETIGRMLEISEEQFNSFTAFSCAGPAYLLYVINAMIDAGVRAGFSRENARVITTENLLGTALKLEQMDLHPLQIVDTMTSPAGVSIEGIFTMNREGIAGSIMETIDAVIQRSEVLDK